MTNAPYHPREMRKNASLETMARTAWNTAQRHWNRWAKWEQMARDARWGSDEKRECEARASREWESWEEWKHMAKHLYRRAGLDWDDPRN